MRRRPAESVGLNLGHAVTGWTASTAAIVDRADPDVIKTFEIVKDGQWNLL